MKSVPLLMVLVLALLLSPSAKANTALQRFEQVYGELLTSNWHDTVTINDIRTTALDYTAIWRSSNHPEGLYRQVIRALAEVRPEQLDARQAEAFWINAYNFGALRLVVDHYPVPSIRSFRISWRLHPWSKKAVQIRGRWYSLANIENQMLLERFGDPRILFAVSCASISCPDQPAHPYTADKLDQQLDTTLRRFLGNTAKGLRLGKTEARLWLSWIFEKDRARFSEGDNGLIGFIKPYLDKQTVAWLEGHTVEVHFLPHDWTLNDLALVQR